MQTARAESHRPDDEFRQPQPAAGLEVYLVPVGPDRYELYGETADEYRPDEPEAASGFVRTLVQKFRAMIAAAERDHREGRLAPAPGRSWTRRMRDRALRWVVEAIAEQRLLWSLRRQQHATLVHPADMPGDRAMAIVSEALGRDADKHRFWLIVDTLGLIVSVLLVLVPGPNIVAYYFAFRVVGHYLSLRGARQGLCGVTWRLTASAPLVELRQVLRLSRSEREHRVREIASQLHLRHLAAFFERTALPTA